MPQLQENSSPSNREHVTIFDEQEFLSGTGEWSGAFVAQEAVSGFVDDIRRDQENLAVDDNSELALETRQNLSSLSDEARQLKKDFLDKLPEIIGSSSLDYNTITKILESDDHFISEILQVVSESGVDVTKDFWKYFDLLKNPNLPIREGQIFMAFMVSQAIDKGKFDIFDQFGQTLNLGEKEWKVGQLLADFTKYYNIGEKGKTISVLLSAREFSKDKSPEDFVDSFVYELKKYVEVLEQYEHLKIPKGLRVSIGMEYEISDSNVKGNALATMEDQRDVAAVFSEEGSNVAAEERYKDHVLRISKFAGIGQGRDALHEIATKATNNPYAMLLEIKLLQDLEFFDFNFEKPGFENAGRGYHLTIGGERGIRTNGNVNFLQNIIVASNWGGVNSGSDVGRLVGARGNIRQRDMDMNNEPVFGARKPAVEFRSLSIDRVEPFERSVIISYLGGIAVQAMEKYFPNAEAIFKSDGIPVNPDQLMAKLKKINLGVAETNPSEREKAIIYEWCLMAWNIFQLTKHHNKNFVEEETSGYLDQNDRWVDVEEFGGQHNLERFKSVITNSDKSDEAWGASIRINPDDLFKTTTRDFVNSLTSINNLYLKPSLETGGDRANSMSLLETTRLEDRQIEQSKKGDLRRSLLDNGGERRVGYYNLQGGSERMLIHSIQRVILNFDKRMEEILGLEKTGTT